MDIDQVVEVPDTPERFINNDGNSSGNQSDGSSSCRVINRVCFNEKLRNEPREKSKSLTFHGNRRLFVRPDNNSKSSSSKNLLTTLDNAHHEKGKTLCNSNVLHRSTSLEGSSFVDLTKQSGCGHVFGKGHLSRKYMFSSNGFPEIDSLDTSSKSSELNNTDKFGPRSDRGLGVVIGGQHKAEYNSSMSSRVTRQKRLVRNGCISPHNIANSKQVSEKPDTDIKDLITESESSLRFKGKGVSNHPSFSEEFDARIGRLSNRSSQISIEATDASNADTFKDSDGWINTNNPWRKLDPSLPAGDPRGKPASTSTIIRDNRNGNTSSNIHNHFEDLEIESAPTPPDTMSHHRAHKLGQFKERAQLTKRQREGIAVSNIGEPSTSRSTRNKNRFDANAATSEPVIELDELAPEEGNRGSHSNEDSGVRALQVEADEILARELQEQLYNEELASAFGGYEMDPHPAYRPASRGSSVSNLYQHSRPNASRNSSNGQRGGQPPTSSTRLARFRGRFPGRPRSLSSTTASRNSIFPANMDLDMRMQILEALEAFNDIDMPNPNHFLQVGREFNENDYEMLLALDDNNHQHGGATHAQISNLPQSTVQAENLQECAVCLETPTIGETIRHLPCLHRFHKDCIDEWLRRKTSCPICKSSVT